MGTHDLLNTYRAKRDFTRMPEPTQGGARADKALTFVIQKHAARNLHYDFRLELQGTLKSWAVPKGPSLDPAVKRMGVHVEDHPLAYAAFEGTIPPKQYGAGHVIVWDHGWWTPVGDPVTGLQQGKLKFELHGEKLKGGWTLVRMHGRGKKAENKEPAESHEPWLLIKEQDEHARPADAFDVLEALPCSVLTLPGEAEPLTTAKRIRTGTGKKTQAISSPRAEKAPVKKAASKDRVFGPLPAGALKAPLPASLAPQLATLADSVPADPQGWLYEIKFDGYRLMTRIDGSSIRCFTRNGHDWSAKLPALVQAIARLGIGSGWLDGEIVVLNEHGLPSFGALQNAFESPRTAEMVYYVFDLPFLDGLDLRQVALMQRREILRLALNVNPQDDIRFSEAFEEPAQDLLVSAQRLGLEGVIGKRVDSPYSPGRSRNWIKLKTQLRQEFVIGGYTEPKGSRTGLGALLLGVHNAKGELQYAGNVGTGFNEKTLRDVKLRLSKLHSTQSPFANLPASVKGQSVKPQLLAEVAFGEWTPAGRVRHAVFQGLRADKPAKHIVRETPAKPQEIEQDAGMDNNKHPKVGKGAPALKNLRITHPERVIDTSSGVTKKRLIEYYASVAQLILPHLKARPVALVRAPSGVSGELFFQKHAAEKSIPGVKLLDPQLDPGHAPLLEIDSVGALLQAAQLNVVEFHTWNATARAIRTPDRMTFDLDPGEGFDWAKVQEAAHLVRTLLTELGLASFLKTSGGKGLHVVVPLKRPSSAPSASSLDFDTVKDFSHAVVLHLAQVLPQYFVARSGPRNRVGKLFVDYLRNGFGATTVSAWSARARPGLGISVPVAWDELPALTGGAHWTVRSSTDRLAVGNQPWADYESSRNGLSRAMKTLGFKPAASRP